MPLCRFRSALRSLQEAQMSSRPEPASEHLLHFDMPIHHTSSMAAATNLIRWEEVRNFAGIENVVEVFQEGLIDDLGVTQHEHTWLRILTGIKKYLRPRNTCAF
eukprot:3601025-Amphidinium_carterae.2